MYAKWKESQKGAGEFYRALKSFSVLTSLWFCFALISHKFTDSCRRGEYKKNLSLTTTAKDLLS